MSLTTHTAVGLLAAQMTSSPLVGFCAALLSHYFTDVIPHGDDYLGWRFSKNYKDLHVLIVVGVDLALLFLLLLFIFNYGQKNNTTLMLAATVGAVMPDLLVLLCNKNENKFRTHYVGLRQRGLQLYYWLLQQHRVIHKYFHDRLKIKVRFRTAIIAQIFAIVLFIIYYAKK